MDMLLSSKINCTDRKTMPLKQRGFTLIEIVVTVAIIAILASIALPNYMDYLKKGRRAAAQSHMMDIAQREQQYFLDARSYAASLSDLSVTTPDDVSPYYTISITLLDGPPPGFEITATPQGAQAGDGELKLDYAGVKSPAGKW